MKKYRIKDFEINSKKSLKQIESKKNKEQKYTYFDEKS